MPAVSKQLEVAYAEWALITVNELGLYRVHAKHLYIEPACSSGIPELSCGLTLPSPS